jgi:acetyl esterase/lipase
LPRGHCHQTRTSGEQGMTTQIWQKLRALGNDFTPAQIEATRDLFAPIVPGPRDVGATVQRDLRYGPDERHRLDVFLAGKSAAPRPMVVFVHGGGFVQGDKGGEGAPFYNNFGAWAARAGFVGVTLTYRLAPAHGWPAGSADVDRAIGFLRTHVGDYGADPSCIVLVGQSAGATHVAGYLAGHGCPPGRAPQVAAAVLLSGIYALDANDRDPRHQAYYGADPARYAERATVGALAQVQLPVLYTISELDPAQFHRHLAAVFAARVAACGASPELLYLNGHNHVSSIMQLGSPPDSLGPELARYVQRIADTQRA